jgi:diguanylate cyclase (GGDEF)-like protein
MPLDEISRRYADALFAEECDKLRAEHERRARATLADQARRGGFVPAATIHDGVQFMEALANARAETLLATYAKAGIPINDDAVAEISTEVNQVCGARGGSITSEIQLTLQRTGAGNIDSAIGGEISRESSRVQSQVHRRLELKRDEAVLASRSAPKVEETGELDDLVPLFSRRQFDTDLGKWWKEAAGRSLLSILFADLDHFKQVNDTYGHQVGDKVLIGVAKAMKTACTGKGRAYRWGGEELAALLMNYTSREALALAERIRSTVADLDIEGYLSKITLSIGVASYPESSASAEALLEHADKATYAAKESGRNRVCFAGGDVSGTILKTGEDQRLSENELRKRVEKVKLWISLDRGKASNFIVKIENKSMEEVVVEEIRLESHGYLLTQPACPPSPEAWKVWPNCTLPFGWYCQTDPATTLIRLNDEKGLIFREELRIVLECKILGHPREFEQKIPVNVNASNQEIVALL